MKTTIITLMTLFTLSANAQMGFAAGYILGSGSSGVEVKPVAIPVSTSPCMIKVPLIPEYLTQNEFDFVTINSSMIAYVAKAVVDVERKKIESRWDSHSDKIKYTTSKVIMADGTTFYLNKRLSDLEKMVASCNKVLDK